MSDDASRHRPASDQPPVVAADAVVTAASLGATRPQSTPASPQS